MNGVRSTFMRRGYLLTALSALLLLAASVGTAEAQSIGFDKTSGSVMESAVIAPTGADSSEHPPLELKVRISGVLPVGDEGRATGINLAFGTITVDRPAAVSVYRVPRQISVLLRLLKQ